MPFKTIKTILLGLILILTILLILQSCKKEGNTILIGTHLLKQDQTIEVLGHGKTIAITASEFSDSRCPPNVQCVWQGYASVKVKFKDDKQEQIIELCTGGCSITGKPEAQIVVLNEYAYQLKLEDINPYPGQNNKAIRQAKITISAFKADIFSPSFN
ncbi:MAG: hypothetical protein V4541_11195 [Bacteroidota bacterium]